MRTTLLASALAVLFLMHTGLAGNAFGEIVVDYVTGDADPTSPNSVATGVTGNNLTGGSGVTRVSGAYNWEGWDEASQADALAAGDVYEWGFSSTVAYDLDNLQISYDAQGQGPTNLVIQADVNGGGFQNIFVDASVSPSDTNATVDLSGFTSVTSADFRLIAWGAPMATGSSSFFTLENHFNGAAIVINSQNVPEPASLAMMGLGGCAIVVFGRRRKKGRKASESSVPTNKEARLDDKPDLSQAV